MLRRKCASFATINIRRANSQQAVNPWKCIAQNCIGVHNRFNGFHFRDPTNISPIDAPIPVEAQANLDDVIRSRLITLKEDRLNSKTNSLSFADIAIRVSNLKGIEHKEHSNTDILFNLDKRTDEEKTRDLIKQFMEERSLDEQSDPIKDIERRLAALKGTSSSDDMKLDVNKDSDSDEEVKVKKIVSKV